MSEFFKNNPIALRHCLLYKFLQRNSIEQAFSVFIWMIGNDVIKKDEFHFWFNQFKKGVFNIYDDKKPITNMKDVLRSDKYALRVCILYESLKYKLNERLYKTLWPKNNSSSNRCNPIFSIFNYFCKVVGKDVMGYPEFEFWFHRFLNGEFDLNYERDKDEKKNELMDMPIDIMENVVEYLDIFDRLKLKKTSRSFRAFVEYQKLFHHTLKLHISPYMVTISFSNSVCIKYIRDGKECVKIHKKRETRVQDVSYWKQAFLDLRLFLKNPKLNLDNLKINLDMLNAPEYILDDLEYTLKFSHYLNVKKLILEKPPWKLLARILPYLKPGYLTIINIDFCNPNVDYSMKKVFGMEQWKQAKYFNMNGACFIWPLRHLHHFEEFHVTLNGLTVEDVREMKEILFKSADFEKCSLIISLFSDNSREIDMSIFEQEFGNSFREDPYIYHYPIPNSTEYFEIEVEEPCIKITRKRI